MYNFQRKHALIIGDDYFNEIITKIVKNIGIEVVSENYFLNGEKIFRDFFIPDFIIVNFQRKKAFLTIFFDFLKSRDLFRKIPIIFYFDDFKDKHFLEGKHKDAHFLPLPIRSSTLVQKIKNASKKEADSIESGLFSLDEKDQFKMNITFYGKMTKICETSCMISAPLRIRGNEIVKVGMESDLFKKEEVKVNQLRGADPSFPLGDSLYESKFALIGINESEAQKIRTVINGNIYNKK